MGVLQLEREREREGGIEGEVVSRRKGNGNRGLPTLFSHGHVERRGKESHFLSQHVTYCRLRYRE